MNKQDRLIITLMLITLILIFSMVNLSMAINYERQETMQNVLRDCKIDQSELKYFKQDEVKVENY